MFAILQFWRVKAWIGAGWRDFRGAESNEYFRWQDKSSAVGWGAGCWNDLIIYASHGTVALASCLENHAIPAFLAPSLSNRVEPSER